MRYLDILATLQRTRYRGPDSSSRHTQFFITDRLTALVIIVMLVQTNN